MSQQNPYSNADERHRKKLFVDAGFGFVDVKARVINPYERPAPQPNLKEIKIINAPSHFHQMGLSSYKGTLNLLFDSREDYHDYLAYCDSTHKFYDELGNIFLGSLEGMKAEPVEASSRYKVECTFCFIRKDTYDREHRFEFQDIEGHWAQTDIEQMADAGIITVVSNDGNPVLYFQPNDYTTRAAFVSFLNRTRRLIERYVRE